MQYKLKDEWDDLDIQDKDYMDVVRDLNKLDIDKFINLYVKPMDPVLYVKLFKAIKRFQFLLAIFLQDIIVWASSI